MAKKSKFLGDFKDFINKGNVVDLAVGVIIGGAFGKIVTSLVNDLLMPLISYLFGGAKFDTLSVILRPESAEGAGDAVIFGYGAFIQAVVDFLIVAFCVFLMVRALTRLRRKAIEKKKAEEAEAKAKEEKAAAEAKAAQDDRDATQKQILETLGEISAKLNK